MTNNTQYTYQQLVSSTDPHFDAFYHIYEEAIPLRERKTRAQISALTENPDYKTLLLMDNNVVIGFSMLYVPGDESFCLLEYMAVHSSYRNLGLGSALFQRSFKDITTNTGTVYALLEVDSDRGQSADNKIRTRRQNFYRRLGCLRIDGLPYLLPIPGEGPPPLMDLMMYCPKSCPPISRQQLEHWLKVIYVRVYDCSADDPRISQMINTTDDPIKLI